MVFSQAIKGEKLKQATNSGDSNEMEVKLDPVPFTVPFKGGFRPVSKVIVHGTPLNRSPNGFQIDFKCDTRGYVPLRLNPRFDGVFTRNWAEGGVFESDDEDRRGPWLFTPGVEFELKITCEDEEFKIEVNGKEVPSFGHRFSPEKITSISFGGDVTVREVVYSPSNELGGEIYSKNLDVKGKSVPFTVPCVDSFPTGSQLVVKGTPSGDNPDRFEVNLECGSRKDIALHLSPKFRAGVLVRSWAKEQLFNDNDEDRSGPCLFTPGQEFKLMIQCEDEGFKIDVNGFSVPSFKHRIYPEKITGLSVDGDVRISKVMYKLSNAGLGRMGDDMSGGEWEHGYCVSFPYTIDDKHYFYAHSTVNGSRRWFTRELLPDGQIGDEKDRGFWDACYPVAFPFSTNGRHFLYTHNPSSRKWFIRELLHNGTMGSIASKGIWTTGHEAAFGFEIRGRCFFYGQNLTEKGWFIRELLPFGKVGEVTSSGSWNYGYKVVFPFSTADGVFFYGYNAEIRTWFIQALLEGGRMGPELIWTQGNGASFAFNIGGKHFFCGQNTDVGNWFIRDLQSRGRLGKERSVSAWGLESYKTVFPFCIEGRQFFYYHDWGSKKWYIRALL